MGNTEYLSAFEQGARRTGLCQELQQYWVFHTQQFPVCIKNGPTTQRTSSQLDITVGSVGVGQDPCGTLSTSCGAHAEID